MSWKLHSRTALMLLLFTGSVFLGIDSAAAKGAIDGRTFDKLLQAQELTDAGNFNEALAVLDGIRNRGGISSYARAQVWNFYGFLHASQNRFRPAIDAYRKVIAEKEAAPGLVENAKYSVAQMYFQLEDYQSVIRFMEDWLKPSTAPTATAHIMLAQAYYQTAQHQQALRNVDKAIAIEQKQGKPLREDWLRLKAALYYDKGDMKNTARAYELLVAYFPRVQYLRQLSGLYGEQGQHQKRLSTFDAIYQHGALTSESEVLNLAYMFLGQNMPYKAGKILEKGFKQGLVNPDIRNTETLANAWAQANEHKKAIPALKNAAAMSDKGLLYARLAGVYFDAGEYNKAVTAANKADKRGGLPRKDANLMLRAMALFNQKKFSDALQGFRQAKKFKASFKSAKKWEAYTLAELERLRAIKLRQQALEAETEAALEADENNARALKLSD